MFVSPIKLCPHLGKKYIIDNTSVSPSLDLDSSIKVASPPPTSCNTAHVYEQPGKKIDRPRVRGNVHLDLYDDRRVRRTLYHHLPRLHRLLRAKKQCTECRASYTWPSHGKSTSDIHNKSCFGSRAADV